jgi:hypothetical protein
MASRINERPRDEDEKVTTAADPFETGSIDPEHFVLGKIRDSFLEVRCFCGW